MMEFLCALVRDLSIPGGGSMLQMDGRVFVGVEIEIN